MTNEKTEKSILHAQAEEIRRKLKNEKYHSISIGVYLEDIPDVILVMTYMRGFHDGLDIDPNCRE